MSYCGLYACENTSLVFIGAILNVEKCVPWKLAFAAAKLNGELQIKGRSRDNIRG